MTASSLTNIFISSKQRNNGYYIESTNSFLPKNKLTLLLATKSIIKCNFKRAKIQKDILNIHNDLYSKNSKHQISHYSYKPTVNINKGILHLTKENLIALSPTNKVVEKGNIIKRIEYNLQKPDISIIQCSKRNYKANNRKYSVDAFAQGLSMGKYKHLY